jgi:hypothetical protein
MEFHYRPEILEQLALHGLRPLPSTRPGFVHRCLSDLYRYELRRLRDRVRLRAFPQAEYTSRVVEVRRQYLLVSLHPSTWTVPGTPGEPQDFPLC